MSAGGEHLKDEVWLALYWTDGAELMRIGYTTTGGSGGWNRGVILTVSQHEIDMAVPVGR